MHRIRRIAMVAALLAALPACAAVEWRGIDKDNWCSGPMLTPEKLKGKVVLVDRWGVRCPPCRRSLPHIEALWKKFRRKPFVIIGSHCQGDERERIAELVKENGLTYSIYLNASLANEPSFSGIPFYYLVNPQGKVVYQGLGFSDSKAKELEDAVAAALAKIASIDSLCGSVEVVHFKQDAAKLVSGKNVEPVVARLKSAASKDGPKAEEAKALVDAVEGARNALRDEIRGNAKTRPGLALMQLETLVKTWPSEKAHCAKALQRLSSSADVKAAMKLRQALEAAETATPRNALEAKKVAESRKAAISAAAPFAKSKFPGVAEEIAEMLADGGGYGGQGSNSAQKQTVVKP